MKRNILLFPILLASSAVALAQPKTDSLLSAIIHIAGGAVLQQVAANPTYYRCQVVYTQINRDKQNRPSFTHYYFNYDTQLYFNPASMVKMPLAFLTLEKLHQLNRPGINEATSVVFDSSQPWQKPLITDSTSITGKPSLGHFIKKAFLISDNDAYNRMYQWVGQQAANSRLHQLGYSSAVLARQFLGLTSLQNRHTNAIHFVDKNGKRLYSQPPLFNTDSFNFSRKILVGKAHFNRSGELIQQPFDFTEHNQISLGDMQQMLQAVMFPEAMPANRRFQLGAEDYRFLRYWLSAYPSETNDPKYDTTKFYNSYVKFFFADSTHRMPTQVRVFNKVGWAYGFMTDVSYVADFEHKVEYMLAATVYVNKDEILNDNKYDIEEIGAPFMYQLGQAVYQYELKRTRRYKPNLAAFRFSYGRQNNLDKRPAVKEADN